MKRIALLTVVGLVASGCTTFAWGLNDVGQLGTGTTVTERDPVVASLPDWQMIATGEAHTCAIAVDGSLWCWGWNFFGQLGDGTTDSRPRPAQVGSDVDWVEVVAGTRHTCARKTDASLWCWGGNASRQLGDYTDIDRPTPTPVLVGPDWAALVTFDATTCALTTAAELWCWGANSGGAVNQTPSSAEDPTPLGSGWVDVGVTRATLCGVLAPGDLWCWGSDAHGELGDGVGANSANTPVQIGEASTWTAVEGGAHHLCALADDDGLFCWGQSDNGQVGAGSLGGTVWSPLPVAPTTEWSFVDLGVAHTCGIDTAGSLWCWGSNGQNRLGVLASGDQAMPVRVGTDSDWSTVAAGGRHTCGRRGVDALCWGSDGVGQTARETTNELTPAPIDPAIQDVAAGDAHSCRVGFEGTLWCAGDNGEGQLGSPIFGTSSTIYRRVERQAYWTAVSAGGDTTCGLDGDDLYCWGRGDDGQIGDGATSDRDVPVLVGVDVADVSTGGNHSCAVFEAGTLSCWGRNDQGQLGTADTTNRLVPTAVGTDADWASVTAGDDFTCARKIDDTLHCWGDNTHGQLGDGTAKDSLVPLEILGSTWLLAEAGARHVCATRSDRSLWCWGDNATGQLGDGTTTARVIPTLVDDTRAYVDLAAGGAHSCAIAQTGGFDLFCWGANGAGQLGDGTTTMRTTLTEVGAGWTWWRVAAGSSHTVAVTT